MTPWVNITMEFQSTLPAWGATLVDFFEHFLARFQSTLPAWGATKFETFVNDAIEFQSTLPAWGATSSAATSSRQGSSNFNPRSPRGERPFQNRHGVRHDGISIHAPRVGSDERHDRRCVHQHISIHAPRVGSDVAADNADVYNLVFQSTLPAWGATADRYALAKDWYISIHAPRVGSDTYGVPGKDKVIEFQSTLPAWGATQGSMMEADAISFQSTLPAWGATAACLSLPLRHRISIHAPRVGSDRFSTSTSGLFSNFNPRSPRGERRQHGEHSPSAHHFNPRSPRGERPTELLIVSSTWHFNPRSPRGERPHTGFRAALTLYFNPRSPRGERHLVVVVISCN